MFSRIALVAVLLAVVLLPSLGLVSTVQSAQPSDPGITVLEQSYRSNFPTGLTMSLTGTTQEPVTQAAIRFRIGSNPTFFETSTRFAATTELDLDLDIPFQYLGLPPGVEIEYEWRIRTASGQTVETSIQSAEWYDDRYDWQTWESEDVIVFAHGDDDALYEYTAEVAQQTVDTFQLMLDAPERPEPIRIWLYNSGQELQGTLFPNSRDWIGGASYAAFSLIAAVAPEGAENTMLRVVPHEVIHQILDDATRNPFAYLPAWFDEGMAGWGQPVGTENMDGLVQVALDEDRLPTIRAMIGEWGSDSESARISYAASFSVVSFIFDTMGEEAILRLTHAYRAGLSHDEALFTALGKTAEELDSAWRASLRS
ncbi:MAG: hypothetical protein KF883_05115 [Thermomicrobiales bacterium]|nr:hypothetical protein [Thermomicrobiales bacterium]